jgi:hypothetical protein
MTIEHNKNTIVHKAQIEKNVITGLVPVIHGSARVEPIGYDPPSPQWITATSAVMTNFHYL